MWEEGWFDNHNYGDDADDNVRRDAEKGRFGGLDSTHDLNPRSPSAGAYFPGESAGEDDAASSLSQEHLRTQQVQRARGHHTKKRLQRLDVLLNAPPLPPHLSSGFFEFDAFGRVRDVTSKRLVSGFGKWGAKLEEEGSSSSFQGLLVRQARAEDEERERNMREQRAMREKRSTDRSRSHEEQSDSDAVGGGEGSVALLATSAGTTARLGPEEAVRSEDRDPMMPNDEGVDGQDIMNSETWIPDML